MAAPGYGPDAATTGAGCALATAAVPATDTVDVRERVGDADGAGAG